MRICYLANGASEHTKRWASAMVDKGCTVDVISFDKADIDGVDLHYVEPVKREMGRLPSEPKNLSYIVKFHRVKQIIGRIKPDIVHAHYATGYGLVGALCNFHPFVISTWGTDIYEAPRKSSLFKWMVEYNLKKADYITATSNALTAETSKYTNKSIHTIPFGIDTNKFCKMQVIKGSNITIGIVKSLERVYGIEYLVEAFKKLSLKYKNIELMIVGGGTLFTEISEMCKDLGIEDRVTMTGKVANDRVPEYLNKMDIFVMPSLNESFGVAALEASACEIPVIAANVGGIPEVVRHNVTGFLIKPSDSDEIAQRIEQLITDEKMRISMGREGRKFVIDSYSWQKNTDDMYSLYSHILKLKNTVSKI